MPNIEEQLHELEIRLLMPAVRRSAADLGLLVADDFREFGNSGRTFTKQQMIDALQSEPPREFTVEDFQAQLLNPGVALVTYRIADPPSLRSSVWVLRENRWQIVFHQGTRSIA